MDQPTAPAQPAAPTTATTPTAIDQAVASKDVSAFRSARAAERAGAPLPPSDATPALATEPPASTETPPASAQPERKVSNRQQQINDYERTIAAQNERIARLEGQMSGRQPAAEPPPADTRVSDDFPEFEDWSAKPENDGQSFKAYVRALYAHEQAKTDAAATARSESDALTSSQRERADRFASQLREAATADPSYWDHISDEVASLRPFNALKPGEPAGPGNVIAEELLTSPVAPQLMRRLSDTPDEFRRLTTLPDFIAKMPAPLQAVQHARWIVREIGKLENALSTSAAAPAPAPKVISDNPAPPTTLGSKPAVSADPIDRAVASGDVGGFRAARLQQRMAALRR